jgi:hypothetical protein
MSGALGQSAFTTRTQFSATQCRRVLLAVDEFARE